MLADGCISLRDSHATTSCCRCGGSGFAGEHIGDIWPDQRSTTEVKASGSAKGKRLSQADLPTEPGESEPRKSGVSHQQSTKSARGVIDYQIKATPNVQGLSNEFIVALGN